MFTRFFREKKPRTFSHEIHILEILSINPYHKPSAMRKKSASFIWVAITLAALFYLAISFMNRNKVTFEPGTCYIKTGLMTELLHEPDLFSAHITTLPRHKEYAVLEVRKVPHVKIHYMLLVEDKKLGLKGWVKTFGLDYVDPACYK